MSNALVSVLTPCYNGEKWISRLMDSILEQTYSNIEFIIVNDGSTDESDTIIRNYEHKFIDRGFRFVYHHQNNKGLGGAIDAGLKLFTGDYLCWLDADDYLEYNSIEERVNYLEKNPEYAIVTSDAYIRDCDDLEHFKGLISNGKTHLSEEHQFEYLLNEDGIFCSGCHMVRTSAFCDVNPKRSIYPARRGQNWQMLLPLYYKYKAHFIPKPLYNYIDYPSSMSKNAGTEESLLNRYDEHEDILIHTLKMIEENQGVDLSKYLDFVREKYCRLRMSAALRYESYELFDQEFAKKKEYGVKMKDYSALLRRRFRFLNRGYFERKNEKK